MSLKFIAKPQFTTSPSEIEKSFKRLQRDVYLRTYFAGRPQLGTGGPLYVKSPWIPPLHLIPQEVDTRLDSFFKGVKNAFRKKKCTSNLLPFQERLLRDLRRDESIIIANSDKGLGPCAVNKDRYIDDALKHLDDPTSYKLLTTAEATLAAEEIANAIRQWIIQYRSKIGDMAVKYIRQKMTDNKDPFGFFYLLYKLHKTPISTRPVCSDCGSLLHPLGKWVMLMLQPIAKKQKSYFQDTFALLKLMKELPPLPPNASFFTCDAVSMYTNIPTDIALELIADYLRQNENNYKHYHAETLIAAMELVFRNNILSFGDAFLKQLVGTAMGISPAPPYATIYFGLHEDNFLPCWTNQLTFYKRFIDDVLGIWIHDPDPVTDRQLFTQFKTHVNNFHGLDWEFTPLSRTCNFMDVTLSIVDDRIESTLFEKKMALYLYIPPHSAHSPGVLAGLVMGNVLRIYQLCSSKHDSTIKLKEFYRRLLRRGYKPSTLLPMFDKAIQNANDYLDRTATERTSAAYARSRRSERQAYFHLLYHPDDPPPSTIQRLWRDRVSAPPDATPFNRLTNHEDEEIPLDQLILAFHRAPNFGNWFSYRKLKTHDGPNVSSRLSRLD